MALDRTTLHWYVPESNGSVVRAREAPPVPAATLPVRPTASAAVASAVAATPAAPVASAVPPTVAPTIVTQFTALEARAIAVQWVSVTWQRPADPGGPASAAVECLTPELNATHARWSTVCTKRAGDGERDLVIAAAVDGTTGSASELLAAAPTKTPANATETQTP